jgi:hypothetical protein
MAGTWADIGKEFRRASAIQRIVRSVAWELLSDPKPLDLDRVPPSPQALTPEYLTKILCAGHPDAQVTSITLGAATSGSGDRCAFSVTYNAAGDQAGLPRDLFHKCLKSFYTRLHLLRCGIIENEPGFYSVIRPELDIEAPRAYHSVLEPRTYRLSIIMDDVVVSKGASFFEVSTPVLRTDIEGMLTILADTHAKYWESPRLDNEFRWLMKPDKYCATLTEGMELRELTATGFERARSVVPPALSTRGEEIWGAFVKSMDLSSRAPLTYLHGDPHLRNYYKTASGRIGLSDWQCTMKGAWSHDFAYAMLTSLPVENRRGWEKVLLKFYLDRVRAKGGNPPTPEAAWELYRRQTLYTFVGWLVTIGFGALQPSMQPDSESLEIIRRAAIAVDDLGSLALLRG